MVTVIVTILGTLGFVLISLLIFGKRIANYFQSISKQWFKEERERLLEQYKSEKEILDEKMKQEAHVLKSEKDAIKELVERIARELNQSQLKIEKTEKERISQFSTLKTVLDEYKVITTSLKDSTDDLKNILSNNQLRGKYGEEVAENLLLSVGFVKGQNYLVNTAQDTVSTRPDITVLLPDKMKMNIDVKFPFQSLLRYQEAEEKSEKERYIKEFANDVRQKIKQVTSRDYINPDEKTVDFVVLFIPNEMVFSFICERLNDVWGEALKKKVMLAGPFSFTAILRMILQAYKNFRYQENLYEIIKLIKMFELEYEKFSVELDALGKRIKSAADQYDTVSLTRTKKLTGAVDKIKNEQLLSEPTIEDKISIE